MNIMDHFIDCKLFFSESFTLKIRSSIAQNSFVWRELSEQVFHATHILLNLHLCPTSATGNKKQELGSAVCSYFMQVKWIFCRWKVAQ
jgi:hypothetical protein